MNDREYFGSSEQLHIAGLHGTGIDAAHLIFKNGFEGHGDVFFAPLGNLLFAQNHGMRRAAEYGDNQYGVVQATFPGRKLEFGMHGDQLKVLAQDAGRIAVVSLRIYDTHGRLIDLLNRK